eukprot:433219_1
MLTVFHFLWFCLVGSYDLSDYAIKTKILCDEFDDLNNWNTTDAAALTYYTSICPTEIAPCLYSPPRNNFSVELHVSASGFTDIELIWDMASFGVAHETLINGKYSCDGTRNTLNNFFILNNFYANIPYNAWISTVTGTFSAANRYYLNQYFKLPQECNNQPKIIIRIEVSNAVFGSKTYYWADFRMDNFCVYGNESN